MGNFTEHGITDDLERDGPTRAVLAGSAWGIEEFHRGLKPDCNVVRCKVRVGRARAVHIGLAIRAFLRLEWHRLPSGVSWFAAKTAIIREAVRAYLAAPRDCLPERATA